MSLTQKSDLKSHEFDLQGKVCLVTGAYSGIGKATAELFLERGASVFEVDIKFERGKANKRSDKDYTYGADLTLESDAKRAVEECKKTFGRIDVVGNCAGVEMHGTVVDLPIENFEKIMNTNVKSIFLVCKYSIPEILKSTERGSIINLSSDLGIQPIPSVDLYAASKGAIIALSKAMSKNWAKQGLRVNCIAPGPVDTPLLKRFFEDGTTLDFVKKYMIPAGRLGNPEEIASVAAFLASDASSFVNGAVITVNGGLLG